MINIAVCDDDIKSTNITTEMIHKWSAESGVNIKAYSFDNGDELISKAATVKMDIIILDIIMPLLNGMEAAKEIRAADKNVKIIFLTSSPEFALSSYEVKAENYIIKPTTYEKLKKALDDCLLSIKAEPENIIIKTACGYQKIYFHDIEYIEAQNKKTIFHLRMEKDLPSPEPLYTIEEKLIGSDGFFKCHRSYIVYIPNVAYFNAAEIITKSGCSIPVSRGCAKSFQEAYFSDMFNS